MPTPFLNALPPTKHKKTRNSLLYSFIHWMATYLNRVDSQVGHSSWKDLGQNSFAIEADGAFRYSKLPPHPSPAKKDDCTHFVCEVLIFLCNWSTWSALNKILNFHMSFYSYHDVGLQASSDHHHHHQQQNKEMLNHVLYT